MIGINGKDGMQKNGSQQNTADEQDLSKPDKETEEIPIGKKKLIAAAGTVAAFIIVLCILGKMLNGTGGEDETGEGGLTATSEQMQNADPNMDQIITPDPNANEEAVVNNEGSKDYNDDGLANNEDSFVQGDPDYADSKKNKTSARVFNEKDFIKDLKGADVSAVYSVKSRDYVRTHVSYVAHRAIMDDGMELYWVDVVYKKKKYRVQVPFYIFKDLEDEGVCRVEIEVLNLEGGGQIISYMQVIDEHDTVNSD